MKIFKSTVSAVLLSSLLTTGIVTGQTTKNSKQLNQPQQQTITQSSSRYVVDLGELLDAGQISFIAGFEREVRALENSLAARDTGGTIIVDRPGIKRVPVVNNLAAKIASGDVAANLRGKRIVKIDFPAIFGDSQNTAEVMSRLDAVLLKIELSKGRAILFVEDISTFAGENAAYGTLISDRIRQSIASGKIKVISASTDEEYDQQIASNGQLSSRFQKVDLDFEMVDADDKPVAEKMSPDLLEMIASGDPNQLVKVILQSSDIKNAQLRALLAKNGVKIEAEAENLNMIVLELPLRLAEQVAAMRGAKHLSLDKELSTLGHIDTTTGVLAAKAQTGNSTLDGRGIGIAVMDSSIFDAHHMFMGNDGNKRVTEVKKFFGDSEDKFGHGTHVAAIAAGRGGKPGDTQSINTLKNYQGVAPEAKIIAVGVLDKNGKGSTAKLIEAINWVYTKRIERNIRVVNLSLTSVLDKN